MAVGWRACPARPRERLRDREAGAARAGGVGRRRARARAPARAAVRADRRGAGEPDRRHRLRAPRAAPPRAGPRHHRRRPSPRGPTTRARSCCADVLDGPAVRRRRVRPRVLLERHRAHRRRPIARRSRASCGASRAAGTCRRRRTRSPSSRTRCCRSRTGCRRGCAGPYWRLGVAGDWEDIALLRRGEMTALFGEPVAERAGAAREELGQRACRSRRPGAESPERWPFNCGSCGTARPSRTTRAPTPSGASRGAARSSRARRGGRSPRSALDVPARVTSPRVRALDTARLACESLRLRARRARAAQRAASTSTTRSSSRTSAGDDKRVLFVGHNPDFEQILHDLTGGRIELKKGGIAARPARRRATAS